MSFLFSTFSRRSEVGSGEDNQVSDIILNQFKHWCHSGQSVKVSWCDQNVPRSMLYGLRHLAYLVITARCEITSPAWHILLQCIKFHGFPVTLVIFDDDCQCSTTLPWADKFPYWRCSLGQLGYTCHWNLWSIIIIWGSTGRCVGTVI